MLRPQSPVGADLSDLAARHGAQLVGEDRRVRGVTLRAQDAADGELFAALPGARAHGAQFAAQAIAAGATAVLTDSAGVELLRAEGADVDLAQLSVLVHDDPRGILGAISSRVYGEPSAKLTLIGITGTSGKTTTAYLTEAALRADGRTVGLVGTVEIRIDGVRVPSSLTTPEAPDLQRLFAVMVERGVDTVVMEVSSHALALGRVDGAHFAIGGFTNLSQDHLDFHPTMEDYFETKARLFDAQAPVHAAAAVICVDDTWGERIAETARAGAERVATVSTRGDDAGGAGSWAPGGWALRGEVAADAGSQTVLIVAPDGAEHVMTVPLPGAYNVANALLATGLAVAAGVPTTTAIDGLAGVAVPGRLEKVERGQDFLAVVDYAHKPAAVEAVLATLAAQTTGRIAVVLGAGGDRDTEKRALMGAAAARGADFVVVTDDNPRSEVPATIRAAVLAGAHDVPEDELRAAQIVENGDRAAAIADAVTWARAGDVVLVAGKGHETGQEIAGVKHPFDDRVVLAEAIDAQGGGDGGVLTVLVRSGATVSEAKALVRTLVTEAAEAGIGSAHRGPGDDAAAYPRTWAIFGEFVADAAAGDDENARCVAFDLLGRQAVRLAVDQTVAVGGSRAVRALYQGAIMEGSWGEEVAFFSSIDEFAAMLAADAGTAAVPRAGDLVLLAGDEALVAAVRETWAAQTDLSVQVREE